MNVTIDYRKSAETIFRCLVAITFLFIIDADKEMSVKFRGFTDTVMLSIMIIALPLLVAREKIIETLEMSRNLLRNFMAEYYLVPQHARGEFRLQKDKESLSVLQVKPVRQKKWRNVQPQVERVVKKLINANPRWRVSNIVNKTIDYVHPDIMQVLRDTRCTESKKPPYSTLEEWVRPHVKNHKSGRSKK